MQSNVLNIYACAVGVSLEKYDGGLTSVLLMDHMKFLRVRSSESVSGTKEIMEECAKFVWGVEREERERGCVVWFQVDPIAERPKAFVSEFEVKSDAPTAEICASRCYQEGCTSAQYDPETKECALSYGDHQHCKNDQQYDRLEANETIWIHCTTCTTFPQGVLRREDATMKGISPESSTLSSKEPAKETSGEIMEHGTTTSTKGFSTPLQAELTHEQADKVGVNATTSSAGETTTVPSAEIAETKTSSKQPARTPEPTKQSATIPESSKKVIEKGETSTGFRQNEHKESEKLGLSAAAETEATTLHVEQLGTTQTEEEKESTKTVQGVQGNTTPSIKETGRSTIEESHSPKEQGHTTEEGRTSASVEEATATSRPFSESRVDEGRGNITASGETEPFLASIDEHTGKAVNVDKDETSKPDEEKTHAIPEDEVEEEETTKEVSTTPASTEAGEEEKIIEVMPRANKTQATSTANKGDEGLTAATENETVFPNATHAISSGSKEKSTTTESTAKTQEADSSRESINSMKHSEKPEESKLSSTDETAESEKKSTSTSTSTVSESSTPEAQTKQSSKLPGSVSAVESAEAPESEEGAKNEGEPEKSFSKGETSTPTVLIINAGPVVVDLDMAAKATTAPSEESRTTSREESLPTISTVKSLNGALGELTKPSWAAGEASIATDEHDVEKLPTMTSSSKQFSTFAKTMNESTETLEKESATSVARVAATPSTNESVQLEMSTSTGSISEAEDNVKFASPEENVDEVKTVLSKEDSYASSTSAEKGSAFVTERAISKLQHSSATKHEQLAREEQATAHGQQSPTITRGQQVTAVSKTGTTAEKEETREAVLKSSEKGQTHDVNSSPGENMKTTTATERSKGEAPSSTLEGEAFITEAPGKGEIGSESPPTAVLQPRKRKPFKDRTEETADSSSIMSPHEHLSTSAAVQQFFKKVEAVTERLSGSSGEVTKAPSAEESFMQSTASKLESILIPDFIKKVESTIKSDLNNKVSEPSKMAENINVNASNTEVEKVDEGTTKSTVSSGVQTTSSDLPVQAVSDLVDALSQNTRLEEVLRSVSTTPSRSVDDCANGRLTFLGKDVSSQTQSDTHFHADVAVMSVPHCARVCYELHCTLAVFQRYPRPACLLRFDNRIDPDECSDRDIEPAVDSWPDYGREQLVLIRCVRCESFSIDEPTEDSNKENAMAVPQIDITNLDSTENRGTASSHQPFIHEGTAIGCKGRLEFQRMAVTSLPKLNVTNDVPARTPADCARKCFEMKDCSLAGYIPSPTDDPTNGVCLLTSDNEVCRNGKNFVPQHASLTPFIISCIKCSPCKYTISTVTPEKKLPEFEHFEYFTTVGKCAEECYKRKCTAAKYDANTRVCSMSSVSRDSDECPRETAVQTDGALPLLLECVQC
ncbi:unnamed protein product [Toxocara canis]|uniref:Apple domain-containing protein n=1 Tax=Toxocara canis TaxID=6265 RepID=A0A183UCS4_TOXCA|nr:unnamed protein product [Toxocara canis]